MPKVLLFITLKNIWTFLFYPNDCNENRPHVHVGKQGVENFCKIWLEPNVELEKEGDLTLKQVDEILGITKEYKDYLLKKWQSYKSGEKIKPITVKLNKNKK